MQYTEHSSISPEEFRLSLSLISSELRIGSMADSSETLSIILSALCDQHCGTCSGDNKCIAHRVFSSDILEQTHCSVCQDSSEPVMRQSFMHFVYATELLKYARTNTTASFGSLLSGCFTSTASGAALPCPSTIGTSECADKHVCRGRGVIRIYLLQAPLVLAFSFVWSSAREQAAILTEFLNLISFRISTLELFTSSMSESRSSRPNSTSDSSNPTTSANSSSSVVNDLYVFKGMVCYYGLHYVSIFQDYSTMDEKFLLFDDARIIPIGSWTQVKKYCTRNCYQPVLLLYEREVANTSTDQSPSQHTSNRTSNRTLKHTSTHTSAQGRVKSMVGGVVVVAEEEEGDCDDGEEKDFFSVLAQPTRESTAFTTPNLPISPNSPNSSNLPLVTAYEISPTQSTVTLHFTIIDKKAYLGLELTCEESTGNVVISGFARTEKGGILPAEKCGKLMLLDSVIRVNDIDVAGWNIDDILALMAANKTHVSITVQSSFLKTLSFVCYYCGGLDELAWTEAGEGEGGALAALLCQSCGKVSYCSMAGD